MTRKEGATLPKTTFAGQTYKETSKPTIGGKVRSSLSYSAIRVLPLNLGGSIKIRMDSLGEAATRYVRSIIDLTTHSPLNARRAGGPADDTGQLIQISLTLTNFLHLNTYNLVAQMNIRFIGWACPELWSMNVF